ncbi:MAG: hypothetical protein E7270_07225 [Lachnospiraceae bacterium]|nr:hypothetical protein [Lachnospiraceae bacterium]
MKGLTKKGMARLLALTMMIGCLYISQLDVAIINGESLNNNMSEFAFATKNELIELYDPSVANSKVGKIVFGKDNSGKDAEWYVLGKDSEIGGENIVIVTSRGIGRSKFWNNVGDTTYSYEAGTGYGDEPGSIKVCSNHYGISTLRKNILSLTADTTYFTAAEKSLMQPTTIKNNDMKNNLEYTTKDLLYALKGDSSDMDTLFVGSNDDKILDADKYWKDGSEFWLRSNSKTNEVYSYYAKTVVTANEKVYVSDMNVSYAKEIRVATNLDVSSVLFAAAAKTPEDVVTTGTITKYNAMKLRFDGSDKEIGNILINKVKNVLVATKEADAEEVVCVVIQGNDGEKDWYYSKVIEDEEVINISDVKSEVGLTNDINLSECKVWMEKTIDGLIYANDDVVYSSDIANVVITGIDTPTAKVQLDTEYEAQTVGIKTSSSNIIWTVNGNETELVADYDTVYTANLTLDTIYTSHFTDETKVFINGKEASVTYNNDGTLDVSYTFENTGMRKIGYLAEGYEGVYDGQPHGINVDVTAPIDATITYSQDGVEYSEESPVFANVGEYTVYYKIEKNEYETATGSKKVKINKKELFISAADQTITYGQEINTDNYIVTGLVDGDRVNGIVLAPSSLGVTNDGFITINIEKVTDNNGIDVTENYAITYTPGNLVIGNAIITYSAIGYEGNYDGEAHSICVEVTEPVDTMVTYSLNGVDYSEVNPTFTDVGEYIVYYKIEKENYDTVIGNKLVKINKIEEQSTVYEIIEGLNFEWEKGISKDVNIVCKGTFVGILKVKIDGEFIVDTGYTVGEDSASVILMSSYLNTLNVGNHTLEIMWENGYATTTFVVKETTNVEEETEPQRETEVQEELESQQESETTKEIDTQEESENKEGASELYIPDTGDVGIGGLLVLLLISGCAILFNEKMKQKTS